MKTAAHTRVDISLRDQWLRTVDNFTAQIADWVRQEPEWIFEQEETHEVEEEPLGTYSVSVWRILTPEGEARLEPMARNYPGRGRFELYAWPSLRRVWLLQSDTQDEWRVLTDSGIYLRKIGAEKTLLPS